MMTRGPLSPVLWAVAAAGLVGCSNVDPTPVRCIGATTTVFDPYRHTICMDSCFDDLDCPRGTLCARRDEGERGSCKLPSELQQTSYSALLDGFGVGEMTASLRSEGALELAWKAPEGARLVHCALLACAPAFRVDLGADTWGAPTDRSAVEIANYDRCTLASEQSEQPEGLFNLRERDNQHTPTISPDDLASGGEDEVKECRGYGCAPISELFAGCWAYDATTIVAATPLFPIDTRLGIYNYHGAFARDDGDCSPKLRKVGGAAAERWILDDSFRACRRDPDDVETSGDETGTAGASREAPQYGVCACVTDPAQPLVGPGVCPDPSPLCKRPCVTDCDCSDEPIQYGCNRTLESVGHCVAGKCTKLPDY